MSLNKSWLYLILIGVLALVFTLGWEVYQISTGSRSKFELTINPITNPNLISPGLEEHLNK